MKRVCYGENEQATKTAGGIVVLVYRVFLFGFFGTYYSRSVPPTDYTQMSMMKIAQLSFFASLGAASSIWLFSLLLGEILAKWFD